MSGLPGSIFFRLQMYQIVDRLKQDLSYKSQRLRGSFTTLDFVKDRRDGICHIAFSYYSSFQAALFGAPSLRFLAANSSRFHIYICHVTPMVDISGSGRIESDRRCLVVAPTTRLGIRFFLLGKRNNSFGQCLSQNVIIW